MSTAWRESSQCVHEAWVTRLVQSRVGEGGEAVVVVEVVGEGEEKKGSEMGVDEELQHEHGLKRTLKDLFSGATGGVAQVLLGTRTKSSRCHE